MLVVDDEPDVAALISDQLEPLDVGVQVANTGGEALAALRADTFDVVTLDILMPGMSGFEVVRAIRADPELRPTPIVFVSVFSSRRELVGELVVSKPIDADELRRVLAAAISTGRSRVLVVARSQLREVLEPALDELGIEHDWELSAAGAARACAERRFEVALVDVDIRGPRDVLPGARPARSPPAPRRDLVLGRRWSHPARHLKPRDGGGAGRAGRGGADGDVAEPGCSRRCA